MHNTIDLYKIICMVLMCHWLCFLVSEALMNKRWNLIDSFNVVSSEKIGLTKETCPTASVLKTLHLGRSRLFCSRHWDWLQYSRFYQMSTSNMGYGRTRAFPIDCKILLSKCCRRSHCLWYHFKTFIRKW